MSIPEHQSSIVLLEPNQAVQVRVSRILAASTQFKSVDAYADIIGATNGLSASTQLLILPALELDLGIQHAEEREIGLAVVTNQTSLRNFEAMGECIQFNHLLSWPDFLPCVRPFDLSAASLMTCEADQELNWYDIIPPRSAARQWLLYSSFDRDQVIAEIQELTHAHLGEDRLADMVAEVAYEMAMNAMYDAPVDEFGRAKYGQDRQQDIALEDHEVPTMVFASDGALAILEIDDPFGRLRRHDVLEGITRGLGAKNAQNSEDVLNTKQGGAGLGIFRMFQLATSLTFDVVKGQRTRVLAVFDLGLRIRDRRTFPTSLHLNFRQEA